MVLVLLEIAAGDRVVHAGDNVAMAKRDAFRLAGRPRRMQQHGNVIGLRTADQIGGESRIGVDDRAAAGDRRVER